jgi:hypothetical protein
MPSLPVQVPDYAKFPINKHNPAAIKQSYQWAWRCVENWANNAIMQDARARNSMTHDCFGSLVQPPHAAGTSLTSL